MAEKKPRGRRPWLDEFRPNDSGQYVYRGSHMKFSGTGTAYRQWSIALAIRTALTILCAVAAGCLNVGALDNTFYVLIPYMLEVVMTAAFTWSSIRLIAGGAILRNYVYTQTVKRLPTLAGALAFAALLTDGCALGFLWTQRAWSAATAVYLLLHAAVCVCSLWSWTALRRSRWEQV